MKAGRLALPRARLPAYYKGLLQKLQHGLLLLVSLLKSGNTGLLKDRVLRIIRNHRTDVGGTDVVRGAGQVLRCGNRDCRSRLQLLNVRAKPATQRRNLGDSGGDLGQLGLGSAARGKAGSGKTQRAG